MTDFSFLGARILVVDDDSEFRELVVRMIQAEGFVHAQAVESAEAALVELYWREYDVILTDLHMPSRSGRQLIENIRGRQALASNSMIGVVAVTGDASVEMVREVKAAGADSYLVKPIESEALSLRIRHAVKAADVRRRESGKRGVITAEAAQTEAGAYDMS
jgi:CheY-like chemotaxis protein